MNVNENENYIDVKYLSHLGDSEVFQERNGEIYRSTSKENSSQLEKVLENIIKIVKTDPKSDALDLYTLKEKVINQVNSWQLSSRKIQYIASKSLQAQIVSDAQNDFLMATYEKLEERLFSDFKCSFNCLKQSSETKKREAIDIICTALAAKRPNEALAKLENLLDKEDSEKVQLWLKQMDALGYPGAALVLAKNAFKEEKKSAIYRQALEMGNLEFLYQLALNEPNVTAQLDRLSKLIDLGHPESLELFGLIKVQQAMDLFDEALESDAKELLMSMAYEKLQEAIEKGCLSASLIKAKQILSDPDYANKIEAQQILNDLILNANDEIAAEAHALLGKIDLQEFNPNSLHPETNKEILKAAARHFAQAASLGFYGPLPDYVADSQNSFELYGFLRQATLSQNGEFIPFRSYLDLKLAENSEFPKIVRTFIQGERRLILDNVRNGYEIYPNIFQTLIANLIKTTAINNDVNKYFHPLKNEIISLNGLRIIINEINQNKRYFENMPCTVCETLNEAQDAMAQALQELSNVPEGKRSFLILHPGGHVVPIYIEKNLVGQFTILNTDTAFSIFANSMFTAIVNSLKEAGVLPDQASIILLADTNIRRQHDTTSCPIFATRDLVQLAKSDSVMKFIDGQDRTIFERNYMEGYKFYALENTPPQMLNTTQSLTSLEEYEDNMPTVADSILEQLENSNKIADLGEATINAKIYLLGIKYQELILCKALSSLQENAT